MKDRDERPTDANSTASMRTVSERWIREDEEFDRALNVAMMAQRLAHCERTGQSLTDGNIHK